MMSNTPGSFGYLLNVFRKRRHLTQKQLAAAIGVHRNAIGRWEQGDFLPATRGIVLELARHLMLDESETRQLLEASLIALSPYWLVPFPRNPFFTGRGEILETLHAQLGVEQMVALTQSYALHGLGGVGKTQVALEYAYRHALEYSAIFWIGAETFETVVSNLMRIAEVLQLPEREDKDQHRVLAAVQRWLTTHSQWLLIWDNVEDLGLLDRFLPSTRQGAILITTRRQALGTLAQGIDLSSMGWEEGILFLLRRAKVLGPEATGEQMHQIAVQMPHQYAAVEELVTAMGGLPLALDQAGAYIEETGCSLVDYLQRYEQQGVALLDRRGQPGGNHPHSVVSTLKLSCQRVAQHNPVALELMRVCAFLYPDAIPEEIFIEGVSQLGLVLGSAVADAVQFDLALAALRQFSLVQRHPETRTLSLHRLVQVILQEGMSAQEHVACQQCVVHLLNAVFPTATIDTGAELWERSERLLPHVMTCAAAIPDHLQGQELTDVLLKAADYLRARSQNEIAESLYQQALQIQKQMSGPEHPKVASLLDKLAFLYRNVGKYEQAEPLFQSAVRFLEQALGPEHPEVASPLEGLALVYKEQGKYALAEPMYQRALSIREQALGPEHPEVALPLIRLGVFYKEQGKYEQAELLYQRALSIREQTGGPVVAILLNNLGDLYKEQGKYEQAEPFCQRAVRLSEQTWGSEHHNVASMLDTLAELYCEWGKYEQAEPLYQRSVYIFEQIHGPEHHMVAYPLSGLAILCREQGKYEEAESLFQRTLQIREQHLGEDHPETAQTLHELAIFHQKRGHPREALSLADRALSIRSHALGETHPKTVVSRMFCAQLRQEQRMIEEGMSPEPPAEEHVDQISKELVMEGAPFTPRAPIPPPLTENDPLQGFLAACCELHPRAWSQSRDLWQAYERWVERHHEHFPLSRSAFIAQLKAYDCRAGRTKTARIWRGIALVNKHDDGG